MFNGHIHPRDVSSDSCLTFTSTLVPNILSLIYTVPRVYRLSPTHSCRIMCLICIVPRVHSVSPTHSCCIMCLICMVPRGHSISPTHSFCIRCISFQQLQSVPISSNQFQLIATDTPNTLYITSPHYSNEASSLTFCTHPHYLISLISFK